MGREGGAHEGQISTARFMTVGGEGHWAELYAVTTSSKSNERRRKTSPLLLPSLCSSTPPPPEDIADESTGNSVSRWPPRLLSFSHCKSLLAAKDNTSSRPRYDKYCASAVKLGWARRRRQRHHPNIDNKPGHRFTDGSTRNPEGSVVKVSDEVVHLGCMKQMTGCSKKQITSLAVFEHCHMMRNGMQSDHIRRPASCWVPTFNQQSRETIRKEIVWSE